MNEKCIEKQDTQFEYPEHLSAFVIFCRKTFDIKQHLDAMRPLTTSATAKDTRQR